MKYVSLSALFFIAMIFVMLPHPSLSDVELGMLTAGTSTIPLIITILALIDRKAI